MSGAESQRARRVAMVVRQALLMIVAVLEKEFGITSKTGGRIRVEFIGEADEVKDVPPPGQPGAHR